MRNVRKETLIHVPLPDGELREMILEAARRHDLHVSFAGSEEEALALAEKAEIILGQSPALCRHAPHLEWMCTCSAGVDHFRREDFLSREALFSNSSGAYGVTISEHVIMSVLYLLRMQDRYSQIVKERKWTRNLAVSSIRDSRITLLGTGDIGSTCARRFRGFEPQSITGVSRRGHACSDMDRVVRVEEIDEVLRNTDILVLSLPATSLTWHLLDRKRLGMLHDGAVIVNVGRGQSLDEGAMEEELRKGRLRAALDVFEEEPLPEKSSLWTCPNLLITPHTAGNMTLPYTRRRIVELFLEDLERFMRGEKPLRLVDLGQGY